MRLFDLMTLGGGQVTPFNFGTVKRWVRADLGVSLNQVSQWNDARGTGGDASRTFVQTDHLHCPTYNPSNSLLNNQPSVDFAHNANPQTIVQAQVLTIDPAQPYTMITVGYDTDFTRQQGWIGDADAMPDVWYQSSFWPNNVQQAHNVFGSSNGTVDEFNATDTLDAGQPIIFMSEFNDPSASTIRISSDVISPTESNPVQGPPATNTASPNPLGRILLGGSAGSVNTWNGSCGFHITIVGIMTTSQRQSLLAYLSARFGIAVAGLPSGVTPLYPTQISGLDIAVLLDPAVTSSFYASVPVWLDQSGLGDSNLDFVQATANNQPIVNPSNPAGNNKPSVTFTTSPFSFMIQRGASLAAVDQPYTMIVIATNEATGQAIIGQSDANNWYVVAYTSKYGASVAATLVGTTSQSSALHALAIKYNDPNSEIFVNEKTPEATGPIAGGVPLPKLELGGANGGGAEPYAGDIFEMLVVGSDFDLSGFLTNYVAPRYGLTIGP